MKEADIFTGSTCEITEKEKLNLIEFMDNKKFTTVIRYRGSIDGFSKRAFQQKVRGIKPSISLFKTKNGMLIGGFTATLLAKEKPLREF